MEKLREETAKYPRWQDFDESNSGEGDGDSTRPISSVGTPQPPQRSGFKLKLNGAKLNGNSSRAGTDSLAQSDDE
jgi:ATP-dependent helicase STH1/SNF2